MGGGYLGNFLTVVIDLVIGLFMFCIIVRFLLQYFRADFYNPLSQFVVSITNPLLKPFRKIIPGLAGLDMAAVALLLVAGLLKLFLMYFVSGQTPGIIGLLVMAVGDIIRMTAYVFMFAMIVRIIMSWMNPGGGYSNNPIIGALHSITEPIMAPCRRILPSTSGLDLSPILVFIAIYFVLLVVVAPIMDTGAALAGVSGRF